MNQLKSISWTGEDPEEYIKELAQAIDKGCWVELRSGNKQQSILKENLLPHEPGIIIQGGGTSGRYQLCLHPYRHLDQSALATGQWLQSISLDPKNCQIVNGLPMCHVSGLLPWWRSRCWGAKYISIKPAIMNNPYELEAQSLSLIDQNKSPLITSLVPTQLTRLIQHPSGIRWLQLFSVIWVGGSAISQHIAKQARILNIRLAPCYGTTETAAMITSQNPEHFLSGNNLLGIPLNDIQLRIGINNALQIRTKRIAKFLTENGELKSIASNNGWWESGDAAELVIDNQMQQLKILGRRDTAINSGGEIVFPEQLQIKLLEAAQKKSIPIDSLLLLPIKNMEWGERIVALVRFNAETINISHQPFLSKLKNITNDWLPYEKPMNWFNCPELSRNKLGKWELQKWQAWVKAKEN
ncbi:AMP-binding protein [Prochlorococcus marinus]|uniref:AMP-binding protein n=1 Tax=Prochlorococcus marinus TaxID=1219 RepID=UPI0022B2ACB0|nr:AMP-binding protein [Prochlorococcus marinus]